MPQRVLVVTDDKKLRDDLVAICRQLHWHVVATADALYAAMIAVRNPPNAILVDANLPPLGRRPVAEVLAGDPRLCFVPVLVVNVIPGQPGAPCAIPVTAAGRDLPARVREVLSTLDDSAPKPNRKEPQNVI